MNPGDITLAEAAAIVEEQIREMTTEGPDVMTRAYAVSILLHAAAALIADDVCDGQVPWQPRMQRYRILRDIKAAECLVSSTGVLTPGEQPGGRP